MTYQVCKQLIQLKDYTQAEAEALQNKLDIFLLNDRLTQEEYEELLGLLAEKVIAQ